MNPLNSLMVQCGYSSCRRFIPPFKETKEGQGVLVLAAIQVTLIQNNQYTIEAYFRAACSGTQHRHNDYFKMIKYEFIERMYNHKSK